MDKVDTWRLVYTIRDNDSAAPGLFRAVLWIRAVSLSRAMECALHYVGWEGTAFDIVSCERKKFIEAPPPGL